MSLMLKKKQRDLLKKTITVIQAKNEAKSNKSPTSLESENNILSSDEEDGNGHFSENEEITITIDISELKEIEFEDRTILSQKVKEWAAKNKTKLNFKTSERENKKSGIKVSTLNCSKKGSLVVLSFWSFTPTLKNFTC